MKTALLIIDVQRGLFDDEPRPYEADAVVERINASAAAIRTHENATLPDIVSFGSPIQARPSHEIAFVA